MLTVNKSQVTLGQNDHLLAEASTIGLAPGEWPDHIAVVDDTNEGFLFQKGNAILSGREVGGYNYFSRSGAVLVVLND